MRKCFTFIARQKRIVINNEDFYIDLLLYTKERVNYKRQKLKIAPYDPDVYWADKIALLGTCFDIELAKLWRIDIQRVQGIRQRLNISAFKPSPAHHWTKQELQMLGTMGDRELGERIGIAWHHVRKKRYELGIASSIQPIVWTQKEIAWLGIKTDQEIGAIMGIPRRSVTTKRNALGILSP
jgi:hypothetical protein